MKNKTFDQIVNIEYPDDFYEMSEEELQKFFGGDMLRFGARNTEKHVILSLSRTKKSLLSLFTNPKSVLSGAEYSLRQNLKDYKRLEEFETTMLSKPSNGIRFEYSASDKDVKQFCEIAVVKYKNAFYITHCLSRLDDKDENENVFKEFRDSLRTK